MKVIKINLLIFLATILALTSCNKDDDSSNPDTGSSSLGTFAGTIQVSDDPQTKLGYIYNAKIIVSKSGNNATIKVKGDLNVDREYTGTINSSNGGFYIIAINKQTKPSLKNATENLVIDNNQLAIKIGVTNDSETVKESPSSNSIIIAGKIQLIGIGMIKE